MDLHAAGVFTAAAAAATTTATALLGLLPRTIAIALHGVQIGVIVGFELGAGGLSSARATAGLRRRLIATVSGATVIRRFTTTTTTLGARSVFGGGVLAARALVRVTIAAHSLVGGALAALLGALAASLLLGVGVTPTGGGGAASTAREPVLEPAGGTLLISGSGAFWLTRVSVFFPLALVIWSTVIPCRGGAGAGRRTTWGP